MLCGALYPAVLVMEEGGPRTARPTWLDDTAQARTAASPLLKEIHQSMLPYPCMSLTASAL